MDSFVANEIIGEESKWLPIMQLPFQIVIAAEAHITGRTCKRTLPGMPWNRLRHTHTHTHVVTTTV